jgi:hypothetical protein
MLLTPLAIPLKKLVNTPEDFYFFTAHNSAIIILGELPGGLE